MVGKTRRDLNCQPDPSDLFWIEQMNGDAKPSPLTFKLYSDTGEFGLMVVQKEELQNTVRLFEEDVWSQATGWFSLQRLRRKQET